MANGFGLSTSAFQDAIRALERHSPESLPGQAASICILGLKHFSVSLFHDVEMPPPVFVREHLETFKEFIQSPEVLGPGNDRELFWLLMHVYLLALETSARTKKFAEPTQRIISFVMANQAAFPADAQARLDLNKTDLAAELYREKEGESLGKVQMAVFEYSQQLKPLVDKIKGWESKLEHWDSQARKLEAKLHDQTEQLNFVGLSRAFENMRQQKRIERKASRVSLQLGGAALVLIPVLSFVANLASGNGTLHADLPALVLAVPFLVVELIALYFFRLFVRNFYSVDAQLLQLDLRYNLCAFIQGYAEFAKEHKGDDGKALERFESLIFSGITADPQNIPSQFDGLEQIGKLAKEIRGK